LGKSSTASHQRIAPIARGGSNWGCAFPSSRGEFQNSCTQALGSEGGIQGFLLRQIS
jgi:hypothetical protein